MRREVPPETSEETGIGPHPSPPTPSLLSQAWERREGARGSEERAFKDTEIGPILVEWGLENEDVHTKVGT